MTMMGIGAGMAALGIAGAYGSGAMGNTARVKAPQTDPNKYYWGGNKDALNDENNRLRGFEDQGRGYADQSRAMGLGAREGQAALADRYQAIEQGKGPSLASRQMQMGLAQSQAQSAQTAASARGGPAALALAQRDAQRQGAEMALSANRDAGMARVQEQLGAMAAQGALYGQMRQGDQAQRGQDMGAYQADMGARYGLQGQQLDANMRQDAARMGAEQWAAGTNAQIDAQNKQRKAALWGSLTGAGGQTMAMGMGAQGAPAGGTAPMSWEDAWVANGGKPEYA